MGEETKVIELGFNKKKTICRVTQDRNQVLIPAQVAKVMCEEMDLSNIEDDCEVVQFNRKEVDKELAGIASLLAKQGAKVKDIKTIVDLLEKLKN